MSDPAPPRVSSRLSNSAKISNSISRRVHREIRFGDYILGSTLGQGEFGKVKLGWRKDGKQPEQVAIKLIRKDTVPPKSNRETKVFREINALKILTHPNIVHLEQVIQNDKYIGIVLEYASGGELFDHILTHRYLKDSVACRLFAQLVSGVHYLHSKGIVHRDLKLENLLLDKHKNIIITDFGFANSFKASSDGSIFDLMSTSCGSPCYAAPELVVSDSKYVGQKVDVWSCGVILYAMLAGYLPFDDDPANPDGDNITQLYKYITTTPLTFPEYIQPMPRDLLRKILVPDPAKRVDLATVRAHPWLAPHAHFLSVTPQEWDQSYLASKKFAASANTANASHLSRSQSVQVKSTPAATSFASHGSSSASSTSNLNQPNQPAVPQRQHLPHQTHQRANSVMVPPSYGHQPPAMATPPVPPQHAPSGHSRRHSVQMNYQKGITSYARSHIGESKPPQPQQDAEELVESLDIPENVYPPAEQRRRSVAVAPISENNASSSTPTIAATSDSLMVPPYRQSPVIDSSNYSYDTTTKPPAARLPGSKKPRPTSFQPTSVGFGNYDISQPQQPPQPQQSLPVQQQSDINFRVNTSSEPRVALNHDSTLPGEISRPTSFRSNPSTAALTKMNSIDENTTKDPQPMAKDKDKAREIEEEREEPSALALKAEKVAKPIPATKTSLRSLETTGASSVASTKKSHRSHRRAVASISYGADKFFSKILGSGNSASNAPSNRNSVAVTPTHRSGHSSSRSVSHSKRHSMFSDVSAGGEATNASSYSISSDKPDKKRFSLNINSSVNSAMRAQASQESVVIVSKPSQSSYTVQESTPRKVLEPAHDAINRQYRSNTTPTKPRSNASVQKVHDRPETPSTARKVVDFFKRRSRMI
ncbi:serine/threonine-protein kinase Kin4p [Trichomonascus vanleenenianus]|uniref:serine/threonine-protein kinase Kin4p n=1 Tax=Trichomonascus vanleenenianus TaxID=2268995 RepID=UPI003EC9DD0C